MTNVTHIKAGELFGSVATPGTLFNWEHERPYTIYEEVDFKEIWSMSVQTKEKMFLFLENVIPDKPNFYGLHPYNNIILWKVLCESGSCYLLFHPSMLKYVYKIT